MGVRPRGNDSIVTEWRFGGVLCERQATEAPFCAPAAEDILRDVGGASSRAEAALSRRHGDPQSGVSEGCAKEPLCAPAAGRRDGRRFLHSRGGKGVEGSGAGLIFPAKTVMIEMERTRRPGCGMSGREGYRDGFFE